MIYTHNIYWNKMYTSARYAFDTTRKSAEIVKTIGQDNVKSPIKMLTTAYKEIIKSTSPTYVHALTTGNPQHIANSNGFCWDLGIWYMALHSTAGVLSAVNTALNENTIAGSLSSGLHHADHKSGRGFCTINGLAVAANSLPANITILDFDAHCGGGTVNTLRHLKIDNRVHQHDISTNHYDAYQPDDNHTITIATNPKTYIEAVHNTLQKIDTNTELIIYNAGTDPYPEIDHDTLQYRDHLVFNHALNKNIPCAYVLAGGYTDQQTMEQLVQSHINTLNAAETALKCNAN